MIFRLLIVQKGSADAFIEASNMQEAREKAERLINAQRLHTDMTAGWDEETIEDIIADPEGDATENTDALNDLTAEEE